MRGEANETMTMQILGVARRPVRHQHSGSATRSILSLGAGVWEIVGERLWTY
jgi:hypothetical protein